MLLNSNDKAIRELFRLRALKYIKGIHEVFPKLAWVVLASISYSDETCDVLDKPELLLVDAAGGDLEKTLQFVRQH